MDTVDETAIRAAVQNRKVTVHVVENWLTPSGRERGFPMYEADVANQFLRVSKRIKAKTFEEAYQKAKDQILKWDEREIRARVGKAKEELKEDARARTDEAQECLAAVQNILAATLAVDDKLDWSALYSTERFRAFRYEIPKPPEPSPPPEPSIPGPNMFQKVIPALRRKWEAQVASAEALYASRLERLRTRHEEETNEWEAEKRAALRAYEEEKQTFIANQLQQNEKVRQFKEKFESGESKAVRDYLEAVFERSTYPDAFSPAHDVAYEPESKTVVVNLTLPDQADVPDTIEYRYVAKTKSLSQIPMKKKEHDQLYDSAIKQTILRTVHEVFESVYTDAVDAVVANGWVTSVDPATGNDVTSCIISLHAQRSEFEEIKLDRVDPTECIRKLKGLIAGPLSQLAPVRPIMQLTHEDPRFVESHEVLADLNSATNLAEIPWEEFEHLVRELFSEMFSEKGGDVHVTQASQDGGVDAVAFDPDPICGGKFVIQAKRYTNVVGVSAVRDLYGTMLNEGAAKGILVTTSHYGPKSRAFAKDKPITLIDGSNLVYLLEKYGHKVRIDVEAARAARREDTH